METRKVKTFGDVDARSLKQLETCMKAGDAEFGVLCADHHPGYSQPIGGAVAYEGFISPSGVGYDIACIAAGARVSTAQGYSLSIEDVTPGNEPLCWDTGSVRRLRPNLGAVAKGMQAVVRLGLTNGRELVATPDHRIRTKLGWKPIAELVPGDAVACSPFVGLPQTGSGFLAVPRPARNEDDLSARGLWPVSVEDPRLPSLIRLLAYNCGDGSLTRDGKRASFWTTVPADAESLAEDVQTLGFNARLHRRPREGRKDELHVYVSSCALHALLVAMGAPVGKKAWPEFPMPWLLAAPAWLRAVFLSAFGSAEASTPRTVEGRACNLAIKQTGENSNAADFIASLFESLGFGVSSPAPSGRPRGQRQDYVIQLLGGEAGQLRYFEEVGFCLAHEKRKAAAAVASIAWQRAAAVSRRRGAWAEARSARATGAHWRTEIDRIAEAHGVPRTLVYHAWYDRSEPRSAKGLRFQPDHSGEIAWVPVDRIEPAPRAAVFDLVSGDPAESFIANGLVVHNCGNKAVRTDIRSADLEAAGGVERVMTEIAERISFGMGVPARERADHPVLDRIREAPFAPQRKMLDLAANQLGTVGSGNHYVNLFADEEGVVWVGVHFGSRGFGHKTASGFLAVAQGLPFDEGERKRLGLRVAEGEMDSPPVLLALDSEAGQGYIEAMTLAGEYAYAGRDVVVDKVLEILGGRSLHEVHNHHNFAWLEEHFGRRVWVVRKGCTPARPGQEGFVGASMGEQSVILEGAEAREARDALYSTVHGAGRVMSRTQAAGKVRRRKRYACNVRDCDRVVQSGVCPEHPDAGVRKVWIEEQVRPGKVDWAAVKQRLRKQGIVLVGGGADEAPEVYKRLPDVLAAHGDSIRVKHTLTPLGVAMAGRDVFDPYKD